MRYSAAITGLGIISSIGCTKTEVTESLRHGHSGIVIDHDRIKAGFRSPLAGRIEDFKPADYGISRKMLRTMCEPAQYAYAAASDALADANLSHQDISNERCGVVFGNDSTVRPSVEAIEILKTYRETHFIGSGHLFRAMNSTVTMNLATLFGTRGANWTISAACASGAHSLGQALWLIRSGAQDIVITGGAQEVNWQSMASFDALGVFSTRQSEPEKACRPFDADRDGLVPSGGAACIILEEYNHARTRRAKIYGIIKGYGFSSDGSSHLFEPDSLGAVRAIRLALADAKVEHHQVDYVNAHATSTTVGDRSEATAIAEVFGERVAVSSTKSMTGHECWMAGASEAVYTCLMASNGFIAPNINFTQQEDDCPRINVVSHPRNAEIGIAVSNSFGFGGTNAALVLDFRMALPYST